MGVLELIKAPWPHPGTCRPQASSGWFCRVAVLRVALPRNPTPGNRILSRAHACAPLVRPQGRLGWTPRDLSSMVQTFCGLWIVRPLSHMTRRIFFWPILFVCLFSLTIPPEEAEVRLGLDAPDPHLLGQMMSWSEHKRVSLKKQPNCSCGLVTATAAVQVA